MNTPTPQLPLYGPGGKLNFKVKAAYHEAGHAVMDALMGDGVAHLVVTAHAPHSGGALEDDIPLEQGHLYTFSGNCQRAPYHRQIQEAMRAHIDGTPGAISFDLPQLEDAPYKRASSLIAGPVAEELAYPGEANEAVYSLVDPLEFQEGDDASQLAKVFERAGLTPYDERAIEVLAGEVQALLIEHWQALEEVAALLAHNSYVGSHELDSWHSLLWQHEVAAQACLKAAWEELTS